MKKRNEVFCWKVYFQINTRGFDTLRGTESFQKRSPKWWGLVSDQHLPPHLPETQEASCKPLARASWLGGWWDSPGTAVPTYSSRSPGRALCFWQPRLQPPLVQTYSLCNALLEALLIPIFRCPPGHLKQTRESTCIHRAAKWSLLSWRQWYFLNSGCWFTKCIRFPSCHTYSPKETSSNGGVVVRWAGTITARTWWGWGLQGQSQGSAVCALRVRLCQWPGRWPLPLITPAPCHLRGTWFRPTWWLP